MNQSRFSNPEGFGSVPGTRSTSLLPALGGGCSSLASLCLLLHSSHPPQPQEPGTAPGPTRLLPCQSTGTAQKGEFAPILIHSLPPCQTHCLQWRPGTIPAQHPPTSPFSLQCHLRPIRMDILAPTAPALILFLQISAFYPIQKNDQSHP